VFGEAAVATGGPTSGRVAVRRERTRKEILDAAWALCREEGLSALSLRDLAGLVGMQAPSLYSYFPSKDAIYDAMFAAGQRQLAEVLALLPEDPVTRDDVRSGARAWFEFCTSDPVRHQLLFQRIIPGFEPSEEAYGLAVENLAAVGRRLAAAGVTDPGHLDLWTAVLTGLIDQQLANDPGGDRWGRLLDDAVDLLCDHTGIPPTGGRRPTGATIR